MRERILPRRMGHAPDYRIAETSWDAQRMTSAEQVPDTSHYDNYIDYTYENTQYPSQVPRPIGSTIMHQAVEVYLTQAAAGVQ